MLEKIGAPKGTRTPVFAVRGRRPRPLDEGSGRSAIAYRACGRTARLNVGFLLHRAERFIVGFACAAVAKGFKRSGFWLLLLCYLALPFLGEVSHKRAVAHAGRFIVSPLNRLAEIFGIMSGSNQ